jgi:FXSXX-COOH protein
MSEQQPSHDTAELRSDLVDLAGVHLDELDGLPRTALSEAVRRILTDFERLPKAYQQYQANI